LVTFKFTDLLTQWSPGHDDVNNRRPLSRHVVVFTKQDKVLIKV